MGLTTVLIGRAEVEDVVQPLGKTSLDLLPAGQIPPNPSELLGSTAMADLLERLSASYDMVLLDSPPLLPVTDAVVLSKLAGGALVVVGVDRIHRPQLQQSLESLETAGAHTVRDCDEQDRSSRGCGVRLRQRICLLYKPKQRSAPVPAKRRWDLDDTLVADQPPRNGHKAGAGRRRESRLPHSKSIGLFESPVTDTGRSASRVHGKRRLEFRP